MFVPVEEPEAWVLKARKEAGMIRIRRQGEKRSFRVLFCAFQRTGAKP